MNDNAFRFRSLEYDSLGRGALREHIRGMHRYPDADWLGPLHVPPEREGVQP